MFSAESVNSLRRRVLPFDEDKGMSAEALCMFDLPSLARCLEPRMHCCSGHLEDLQEEASVANGGQSGRQPNSYHTDTDTLPGLLTPLLCGKFAFKNINHLTTKFPQD